jgi:hypothetical protein
VPSGRLAYDKCVSPLASAEMTFAEGLFKIFGTGFLVLDKYRQDIDGSNGGVLARILI